MGRFIDMLDKVGIVDSKAPNMPTTKGKSFSIKDLIHTDNIW